MAANPPPKRKSSRTGVSKFFGGGRRDPGSPRKDKHRDKAAAAAATAAAAAVERVGSSDKLSPPSSAPNSRPNSAGSKTSPTSGKRSSKAKGGSSPFISRRLSQIRWPGQRRSKAVSTKAGKGHVFESYDAAHPTWCDRCDGFVWGLFNPCVRCSLCEFTCHNECQALVSLDCRKAGGKGSKSARNSQGGGSGSDDQRRGSTPNTPPRKEHPKPGPGPMGLLSYLDYDDVKTKIDEYNRQCEARCSVSGPGSNSPSPTATATEGSISAATKFVFLNDDGKDKHFKGHIRVTMNLSRPVRVANEDEIYPAEDQTLKTKVLKRSASSSSSPQASSSWLSGSGSLNEATFYLPENVSKGLFLTSSTCTQEVICILLTKFEIISDPRKFSLYEKNRKDGSKRRLRRYEEPLVVQLLWGGSNDDFSFSLEDQHEEQDLEALQNFSVPELENFLKILEDEHQLHVEQVVRRYEKKGDRLRAAIAECTNVNEADLASALGATDEEVARRCDELELTDAAASAEAALDEFQEADAAAAIGEL